MKQVMVFLASIFLSLNALASPANQDNCNSPKKFKECTSSKVYEGDDYIGCNVSEKDELQFFSYLDMTEVQCVNVCDTQRVWFGLSLIPNIDGFL